MCLSHLQAQKEEQHEQSSYEGPRYATAGAGHSWLEKHSSEDPGGVAVLQEQPPPLSAAPTALTTLCYLSCILQC